MVVPKAAIVALLTTTLLSITHMRFAGAAEAPPAQELITIPVRVLDAAGQPVAGATVIPWALRCSQGHGQWSAQATGGLEPPALLSKADGHVDIPYPKYAGLEERLLTTEVTISIDHPRYAYISHEFINVPRPQAESHEVTLSEGAVVEVAPLIDGQRASLDGIHALWSDGRSWKPSVRPTATPDGALQIPAMPAGSGEILLVQLAGGRATHFSRIVALDLQAGETVRREVELQPAVEIRGKLSDDVPRPVRNGRVSVRTLPSGSTGDHVLWTTWAPVADDGSFTIESWPAGETLQLIALCDGYIAKSPQVLDLTRHWPKTAEVLKALAKSGWGAWRKDPFQRPQLFSPDELKAGIVAPMEPLVRCEIEAVDDQGRPLAGVNVVAWPNVGWWNWGSQIYCASLVRGERLLVDRDYDKSLELGYPKPFEVVTDARGRAVLEVPTNGDSLFAEHTAYELPVVQGWREVRVQLVAGKTAQARLQLQPKGREYLGEWDKLAGVLFGCTGEQCRRLLEDEGFRKQITLVRQTFDAAENPRDPKLLKTAYKQIAGAFDELEDQAEAEKWRRKAAEQGAKLAAEPSADAAASAAEEPLE